MKSKGWVLAILAAMMVSGCAFQSPATGGVSVKDGYMLANTSTYTLRGAPPECRNTTAVLHGCTRWRLDALYAYYKDTLR